MCRYRSTPMRLIETRVPGKYSSRYCYTGRTVLKQTSRLFWQSQLVLQQLADRQNMPLATTRLFQLGRFQITPEAMKVAFMAPPVILLSSPPLRGHVAPPPPPNSHRVCSTNSFCGVHRSEKDCIAKLYHRELWTNGINVLNIISVGVAYDQGTCVSLE